LLIFQVRLYPIASMPVDGSMYPANNAALLDSTAYNSILSPATKRYKVVSSLKITDSIGCIWSNPSRSIQMNSNGSRTHSSHSSRISNIRCVSESSFKISSTGLKRKIEFSNSTPSFASSYIENELFNQGYNSDDRIRNSNLSISSFSRSFPLPSRICEALQGIINESGTEIQSEQRISQQCFFLATLTRSTEGSTGSFVSDARSTPTMYLTCHQVALTIASHDGINIILNAMKAHLDNVEIQEYGCMALGNILAILYRRHTAKLSSLHDDVLKTGNACLTQVFCAMQNHPQNVAVHCAAIIAMQQCYYSIFLFQTNGIINDERKQLFIHAQTMFLPSKIRRILLNISFFVEQNK
jgi:hypothetical protein